MICPACRGSGKSVYYVETDRDENTVTIEQRTGICQTCNGSGKKPMTNADRFRAMPDEEQQNFVRKFWEIEDFADWLKQSSKGE